MGTQLLFCCQIYSIFCKSYFQDEQGEYDTILSEKSEGKKKKAGQLTKKKKRKKTKKAENEDKPEQQGQTSVNDTTVGDFQGKAVHVHVQSSVWLMRFTNNTTDKRCHCYVNN